MSPNPIHIAGQGIINQKVRAGKLNKKLPPLVECAFISAKKTMTISHLAYLPKNNLKIVNIISDLCMCSNRHSVRQNIIFF